MAYGRIGIDVFQIGLHHGAESPVNHRNRSQYQEEVAPLGQSFRHQVHGNAETPVATQFHQHAGMQHGHRRRGGSMAVGTPCMEREQGTQYAEAQEHRRKEQVLHLFGDIMQVGNLQHIHRLRPGSVIDAQDTDEQESRPAHQHQRQFHGGIFLTPAAPYTNEQVHRNESHLIKHEHGEKVGRNEETEYARGEQGKPQEIFFREGLQFP